MLFIYFIGKINSCWKQLNRNNLIPLGNLKELLFITLMVVFACEDEEKESVRTLYIPS